LLVNPDERKFQGLLANPDVKMVALRYE
jgi:hypothetical protein